MALSILRRREKGSAAGFTVGRFTDNGCARFGGQTVSFMPCK